MTDQAIELLKRILRGPLHVDDIEGRDLRPLHEELVPLSYVQRRGQHVWATQRAFDNYGAAA
jgi:hypothetical protein